MKIRALVVFLMLLVTVQGARSQTTRSRWHTVRGIVVNDIGRPAARATVYLRDVRGHRLRMKQADNSGSFDFGLVNTENEYEIYAEEGNLTSQKLPIPTAQPRRELVFKLVLKNKE